MSIPNINVTLPFTNRDLVHAPNSRAPSSWRDAPPLHVAAVYTNPLRWRSRRILVREFRAHMEASTGVVLHVAELADTATGPSTSPARIIHSTFSTGLIMSCGTKRTLATWRFGISRPTGNTALSMVIFT